MKEATEALVETISQQQDEIDRRNEVRLDSFHKQIAQISNLILPSSPCSPKQHPEDSQVPPNFPNSAQGNSKTQEKSQLQCEICDQHFETDRAMKNHIRRHHQP